MANFTQVGVDAIVKNHGKFMSQMASMDDSIQGFGDSGSTAAAGLKTFAIAVAAAAAAAIVAGAGIALAATKVATDWQDSFADVVRTTNDLGDEFGDLTPLGEKVLRGLRDIALQIPVSMDTLTDVAAIAGKMGIAEESIVEFTEVMAKMADVTDLSATQASQALAQFAAIMGTSGPDVERLASTIVALGNAFPPSEAAIVRMIPRLAFLGKQAGLSEVDVLAMATATQTLGFRSEAASTAMVRAFLKMGNAVKSGNKDLAVFAAASQMTVDEFVRMFEVDAFGAFQAFINGLSEQTEKADSILMKLGMASARYEMVTLGLAASQDILAEAWEVANKAWEENTALTIESQRRYGTLAKQLDLLKNIGQDVLGSIGIPIRMMLEGWLDAIIPVTVAFAKDLPDAVAQHLIPKLTDLNRIVREDLVPWLKNLWEWVKGSLIPALQDFGKIVGDVVAFLRPAIDALAGVRGESVLLAIQILALVTAFSKLQGIITAVGSLSFLGAGALTAASSIGILVIAIGTLVIALDAWATKQEKINAQLRALTGDISAYSQVARTMMEDGKSILEVNTLLAEGVNKAAESFQKEYESMGLTAAAARRLSAFLAVVADNEKEIQGILVKNTNSYDEYERAVDDYNSKVVDSRLKIDKLTKAQHSARIEAGEWIKAIIEEASALDSVNASTGEVTMSTEELMRAIREAREAEEIRKETLRQIDLSLQSATTATAVMDIATAELQAAEEAGIITTLERAAIEQALAIALGISTAATYVAVDSIRTLVQANIAGIITTEAFMGALAALRDGGYNPLLNSVGVLKNKLTDYNAVLGATTIASGGAGGAAQSYTDKLKEQREALQGVIIGHLELAERLIDPEATTIARIGIEDLRGAYEAGLISFDDYALGLEQIQDSFELVTPESRRLANAIGTLKNAMRNGWVKAEIYDDILMEIFKRSQEGTLDMEALFAEFGLAPEAIDPAGEAVDEFGNKISLIETPIEAAKRKLMELPTTLGTVESAFSTAGPAMVNSFASGWSASWDVFMATVRAKLQALRDLLGGSEPKDTTSPLHGLGKSGEGIVFNIAAGVVKAGPNLIKAFVGIFDEIVEGIGDHGRIIDDVITEIVEDIEDGVGRIVKLIPNFSKLIAKIAGDMEDLFDAAGVFGGLGDIAAEMFEEKTLAPIEDEIDAANESLEEQEELLKKSGDRMNELRKEAKKFGSIEALIVLFKKGLLPVDSEARELAFQFLFAQQEYIKGQEEVGRLQDLINDKTKEYADENERILALQEKQQQLEFLESQFELLKLIREHGLDPGAILGDLKLGIDANLADVIDAMVAAMALIVEKINAELEMGSPSKVFKDIGENMMLGLVSGWTEAAGKAQGIMGASMVPDSVAMAPVSGGASSVSNESNITFNNTISNGMEMAQFEQLVLRVVGRDMAR